MKKRDVDETQYWLSYSDMMAGLLLIFIIIIVVTMLKAQEKFEIQQRELSEQQRVLNEQQDKIDKIVGIRSEIIEKLAETFNSTKLNIKIDDKTGAIVLDSNILFERDKYILTNDGREFLKEFIPVYIKTILNEDFKDYIAEIIIEGYTDSDGEYIYNLKLSQNRSMAVVDYILDIKNGIFNNDEIDMLIPIIVATGKSYNNLIYNQDGSVDKQSSRRVEIKFRLKDTELIEDMQRIIEEG